VTSQIDRGAAGSSWRNWTIWAFGRNWKFAGATGIILRPVDGLDGWIDLTI